MPTLKTVSSVDSRIELPGYISKACSEALAHYCAARGITDIDAIRDRAALVEETAQRIHLALIESQQK